MLKIAILQISSLPMGENRLEYYIDSCKSEGSKVVLIGEYVLNRFFKELVTMPFQMIREQSKYQLELLTSISNKSDIIIVAPIIIAKGQKLYKTIVKITPHEKEVFYYQQKSIAFEHWNEKDFFANKSSKISTPMIFELDGFKIGVIAGFEIHYDLIWLKLKEQNVDIVLMPTASTFNSQIRWKEIIKTRAFLNSCYIIRANRVGEYIDTPYNWKFYGNSLYVLPNGELGEDELEDKDNILVVEIDSNIIKDSKEHWSFQ